VCALQALELQPLHAPALALRATMDECSEIYASEATKLALLGLASDAATNLQHARELRPADASLRIKFAMTLRQQGKLHEAVEVLEGVAREGGDAVAALARRSLALAYNDVGVAQAMSGQLEPAVRSFGLAIEVGGADAMAAPYANRADCFRQLQRPTDAIDDYERAAGLAAAEPELHWQIQTRMAMLHNDTGLRLYNHAQPRKAALAFSRAIECNPRVARFYLNRAEATMQLSRYELARDDLLVSLRFDPANTRARSLLASLCP
jgi:tetratricopeptide (TPR) repeat protein